MREGQTRRPAERLLRGPLVRPWRIALRVVPTPKASAPSPLLLIYGFAALIALGTLLLVLPFSSKTGAFTSTVDSLFTATSAVCVTGLTVVDTGTHWSSFGQGVILALIQLGGFGFMASGTIFLLVLGRRIGLRERLLIGESMGLRQLGGLVRLVIGIAAFTVLVEAVGAGLFYLRFSAENPTGTAAWKAVFHAISAFNNAGFDVFGHSQSLMEYRGDVFVVLVTAVLIVLGGISFLVVADVLTTRRFPRLSLDSKMVLAATASLLILGTLVTLLTEFSNPATLGALPVPQKVLNAFFQSVTSRTAGFATIDIGKAADYSLLFTILLMFVGGASGSTAGGTKVNTFSMLIATIWSSVKGREHAGAFGREFATQQIYRALAVVMLSLGLVSVVVLVLTVIEPFTFIRLLFETFSAFGTVGLSTGITPDLSTAGRLIIAATMFVGRLGPLTLALSLVQRQQKSSYRYPQESVRIG